MTLAPTLSFVGAFIAAAERRLETERPREQIGKCEWFYCGRRDGSERRGERERERESTSQTTNLIEGSTHRHSLSLSLSPSPVARVKRISKGGVSPALHPGMRSALPSRAVLRATTGISSLLLFTFSLSGFLAVLSAVSAAAFAHSCHMALPAWASAAPGQRA